MQVILRLEYDYKVQNLVLDCVQVILSLECDDQGSKGKQFWIQNMITKSGMWLPSPEFGLGVHAGNFKAGLWLPSTKSGIQSQCEWK